MSPAGRNSPPLLVLFGPTAAGKTEIAEEVARRRSGEIVSADAFAVYRGFDVGTAKPSREGPVPIPYHLIDVADPREAFSAGRWAADARIAIDDIAGRGKLPIICGGSGFYVSALLDGLAAVDAPAPDLRDGLVKWASTHGAPRAHRILEINDPGAASRIPVRNLRRTLRALEILFTTGARASSRVARPDEWREKWRVVKVVIEPSRRDLYDRIDDRVRRMLDGGWDDEVRHLVRSGLPLESNAFGAIGYREVARWISGRAGREETQREIVAATRRLAKRQKTWLAREREAIRVTPEEALPVILQLLDSSAETEKTE
jgi:tRNA dimethylallyltransferase